MKKFVSCFALLFCSITLFANDSQNTNTTSPENTALEISKGYNIVNISYDRINFKGKEREEDENSRFYDAVNGIGLEYIRGIRLTSKYPLFFELGGNISYTRLAESEEINFYKTKNTLELYRLSIPLSVSYNFAIDKIAVLAPFAGFDLRFNVYGCNTTRLFDYGGSFVEKERINVFSEEDMGDWAWKRFQLGWHIGVRCIIDKAVITVKYGTDFTHMSAVNHSPYKFRLSTENISAGLGLRF